MDPSFILKKPPTEDLLTTVTGKCAPTTGRLGICVVIEVPKVHVSHILLMISNTMTTSSGTNATIYTYRCFIPLVLILLHV